jgi:hypothetical protein
VGFGGDHRDGKVVAIPILVLARTAAATEDNPLRLFLRSARFQPIQSVFHLAQGGRIDQTGKAQQLVIDFGEAMPGSARDRDTAGAEPTEDGQLQVLLDVRARVRAGDLTVTPRGWTGLPGKVADVPRKTTQQNIEQDSLNTKRERPTTRMRQGQRELDAVSTMILSEIAPLVCTEHGVFHSMTAAPDGEEPQRRLQAGYGRQEPKHLSTSSSVGEGLVDQFTKKKKKKVNLLTNAVVGGECQRGLDARSDDVIPEPANSARLLPAIVPWLPQPAGAGT